MHIKIYFGDKPVFLCDEISPEINGFLHHPDAVFIDEITSPAINSLLHEIKKQEFHAGVMLDKDLEKLKKEFFKHFTLIEAAGGIVQNEKKQLLFIYRLDKWDLPKGKIEKNEQPAAAAVREVEEETGIRQLSITKNRGTTYHTYDAYGKHYLKTTYWYDMTCPGNQTLVPQTEENITQIKWVKTKDIKEVLANTYPSIRDIFGGV
jgi:ADP-ribose pyrophosphatase YjhB (NUDIX family)